MRDFRFLPVLIAFFMPTLCQSPALSHNHTNDFSVNQLQATCTKPGDTASASFVTDPESHRLVLQLLGTGTALASGTATFTNTTFQTVSVLFQGDCVESLLPATFIVRIGFIKPGTTVILNHGYDCARNTQGVLPNGLVQVFINSHSVCDCDDMIPPGSQLLSVSLDLVCADTNPSTTHKEMVHNLYVNNHPIPFNLTSASASCQ
jgi:hypothetical protein